MPLPDLAPPLEKRLYREDVYTQLRDWIVHGILEPEEKLRDTDLAQTLGVSRTPVREALRRLEDEGLVQTKLNAWTRVAPVSRELAARIYPILRRLEPLALELAAPHLTAVDFARMRDLNAAVKSALESNDAKSAALHDADFHECFTAKCGNPELQGIIRTLKTNHIRLEFHYWSSGSLALESVVEHAQLVDALERGDVERAGRALENNWIRALERWERL
jgi:DNA-binding GntR family transcriptional regulator